MTEDSRNDRRSNNARLPRLVNTTSHTDALYNCTAYHEGLHVSARSFALHAAHAVDNSIAWHRHRTLVFLKLYRMISDNVFKGLEPIHLPSRYCPHIQSRDVHPAPVQTAQLTIAPAAPKPKSRSPKATPPSPSPRICLEARCQAHCLPPSQAAFARSKGGHYQRFVIGLKSAR